ncbi:hypothetical protein HK102_012868 [Quaeritorhiza haematococci]|nr:hypothetical protein HK102_012868 [Quaeritorhiza haematococci]
MGITLGTPLGLTVPNLDQRPHDYSEMDLYPRPSHADYTYLEKYGVKASSGGGRSSARETIGRVAAGAIAEKYLKFAHGVEIVAFVSSIGHINMEPVEPYPAEEAGEDGEVSEEKTAEWKKGWEKWWSMLGSVRREDVDKNEVRCPDEEVAERMRKVREVR